MQRATGTRTRHRPARRPGNRVARRPDEAFCSACGAPIRWAVTARGKNQPLDYDPNPEGNIRLRADYRQTRYGVSQACEVVPFLEQLELGREPVERYIAHFATCANPELLRATS